MRPTPTELLRGVVVNFEQLIMPQLEGKHAISTGSCIRMLLNHVILRLDQEGPALVADSTEKRALLAELADSFERAAGDHAGGPASSAALLRQGLGSVRGNGVHVGIDELTAENNALKQLLEDAIVTVHDHRTGLPDEVRATLVGSIRSQLRAQIDRELAMVAPAMDAHPF